MRKRYVYVVLTKTNSVLSKSINYITKDKYTHAAVSLDKELNQMYGFSRKYTNNPFIGIFKREDIYMGLYSLQKQLPGAIIQLEVSEEEYYKFENILYEFIENSHKYKYNTRGLFYGLINRKTKSQNKFLCSEFVYYILNKSGIVDWNIPRNLVKPIDFLQLDAKIVYEGDLKQMDVMTEEKQRALQALYM